MNILLTGGAGYIGSHTAVVLSQIGHKVVVLDNFYNSNSSVFDRLHQILGKSIPFVEADVRDTNIVEAVLRDHNICAVIHFAGLKAVAESVADPIRYFANNVQGSISLLEAMQKVGVKELVFSSSATVYGNPQYLPYDEEHPTNPMNPYGQSKLQIEQILRDLSRSDPTWKIVILRYFNPVGAHESGLIGEDPNGIPNNLMPYIARVASGELPHVNIFGNNYETRDGTGERDYIHVMDVADGHKAAISYLDRIDQGFEVVNLGTGKPISVSELISAYEEVIGCQIKTVVSQKRDGDLPVYYADVRKSKKLLHWEAIRSIENACETMQLFMSLKKK